MRPWILLSVGAAAAATLPVLVATACVPTYAFGGAADASQEGASPIEGGGHADVAATVDAGTDAVVLVGDASDAGPSGPLVVVGSNEYADEACALYQGSYRCWGDQGAGGFGELGFSTDGGAIVPPAVMRSVNGTPAALVFGDNHACAIYDRVAFCRGRGEERGNPLLDDGGVETPVLDLPDGGVDLLAAGEDTTCAVTLAGNGGAQGNVYCWGWNSYGTCGRPLNAEDTTVRAYPVVMSDDGGVTGTITDARLLALGGQHACAATDSGAIYCWGTTVYFESGPKQGLLCDPYYAIDCDPSPQRVTLPTSDGVAELALGYDHSCAMTKGGSVYCWGSNQYGQVGVATAGSTCVLPGSDGGGSTPCASTPTPVPGLPPVQAISAGGYHTCAIDMSQHVWCWGDNDQGQLGVGDNDPHVGPVEAMDPTVLAPIQAAAVAAGGLRTCARSTAGQVLCWGSGELATEAPDAAPPSQAYPAPVLF